MVEYHGWAVIRESANEAGESDVKLAGIVQQIQGEIDRIKVSSRIIGIKTINGTTCVWLTGCNNHRGGNPEDSIVFFKFLAEISPGSYGLLYMLDDEDRKGFANEFRVWRLARGVVTEGADSLLSPFRPVVED